MAQSNVSITVNAQLNRHAISPNIYGTAFATTAQLADLNCPLNRSGGNTTTRHNWQINASNHAADWYFESLEDSSSTVPGAVMDDFISTTKSGGAQPMVTIPMIGWIAKLGPSRARLSSFSIAKYGAQTDSDWQWFADAGNGVSSASGQDITGNNPADANTTNSPAFQQGFVQHLTNQWGGASNNGVRYYLMDNEPSLWFSTHRDVHPAGPTMQEIRTNFLNYATMVKGIDPAALVCGPEEWGWPGYFYSGYDQQWAPAHTWDSSKFPDRATNGGWDFCPWFLDQARQRATNTNQRLLDYFTLHCYPQGGEGGNDVSTPIQQLRNRSTRSLWDSNYLDESWINDKVYLIPRMKSWVTYYYPGTKTGITEYNWGAEGHMNGAMAQADLLGIFGREGLDLATRWTTPATGTPAYLAMKFFRNYDGSKSGFGDVSIAATGPNPDNVSTFAAIRSSDGALTLMVINKQGTTNAVVAVSLTNFPNIGKAQVWQLKANTPADQTVASITHLSDLGFSGNMFSNTVPSNSVTLFILPGVTNPVVRTSIMAANHVFSFWMDGQAGQRYIILSSSNLMNWSPVWTNTLTGASTNLTFPAPDTRRFYRAEWTQ
ncbi:MAG: glycoside hydrolase family 44 protein [Verrucomicrobiae bacterium]|nr:glycoside hydrolase family 44 protein [Verrucomicrobiae bacterium]